MGFFKKIISIDDVEKIKKESTFGSVYLYPNNTKRTIKKFNLFKWKWEKYTQYAMIESFTDGDSMIYDNTWNNK